MISDVEAFNNLYSCIMCNYLTRNARNTYIIKNVQSIIIDSKYLHNKIYYFYKPADIPQRTSTIAPSPKPLYPEVFSGPPRGMRQPVSKAKSASVVTFPSGSYNLFLIILVMVI